MPIRVSYFLIQMGVVLIVLAVWYCSYRVVRWDTRRRGLKPAVQKAWITAVIGLPLFGFALYLFIQVLQRYLTPVPPPEPLEMPNPFHQPVGAAARPPHQAPDEAMQQVPVMEPAWGKTAPARSNGKGHEDPQLGTARVQYQLLRGQFSLAVVEGPLQGQHFIIKSYPALIGRGAEATIALDPDLNVSRKHAEIYEWSGMLRIRDLDSLHGTHVNDFPVRDQALRPGDRIKVGETVLVLRELP